MPKDRNAFRERFLRWRQTGELPYEAGRPIEQTDAVRTDQQSRQQLRQSVAGANEALRQAMMQRATVNPTQVSADTRTATERRQLQQQAAVERERYRKQQQKEKAQKGFETLMSLTAPSTYVGQAIGQPITGAAALATDALVLGAAGALKSGVKAAVQGTAKASRNYRLAKAIDKAVTENPTITAYNRNPAIMDTGSLWDYQTYLQQLFPESKIKDILWHGSTQKDLQRFSAKMIGSNAPIEGSTGMYLAPEKTTAANYGSRGGVYPVKLNSKNPYITGQMFALPKNGVNVAKISPEVKSTVLRENDAVVAPKRGEIAFFDPNDALILGSNEDLQEFRAFVNTTPRGLLSNEPLIARGTNYANYGINAAGITPEQWTIAQDAAIARGDMAEAQRLRDLHFKVSAPDNKLTTKLYHGTDSEWNSYDPTHFSSGSGDLGAWGKGLYLSGYKNVAERYGKNIKSLYAYARNPLEVKPTLGTWYDTPTENAAYFFNREKGATKEIKNILKGKDAINKYREITGDHWITTHEPYEEVVIPQGKNIKSADAVTYDDKGVRIPLGERDNFKLNDIRYNIRNISGQEINSAINRGFTERFAQQFHQFPQEVENILTSQIVPRRLRMLKRNQSTDGAQKIEDFVKRNGEVDFSTASGLKTAKEQGWTFEEVQDYMQYKDYQSALNEMLSNGYTQYPRDAWNARHPAPDKNTLITGVYDGTTDKIELPEGFNALDAAHEARHRMQMKTPTIHTEENILHNAYDYNLRDTEFGKMIYEKELETVNLELREALLRENKASNMSLNTQDALLGSNVWYSDDHILHTLQRTNSYGKHIVENINRRIEQIKKSIQNKGLIPGTKEFDDEVSAVKHSIVENIRYAVQAVGVAAAAIKLNNK